MQEDKINEQVGVETISQLNDPLDGSGFFDLNYRHNLLATKSSQDIGCAPAPDLGQTPSSHRGSISVASVVPNITS